MATKGLIHLYHGDGKGKTTAALGLCLRALGAGYRVCLLQFLKTNTSSELELLKRFDRMSLILPAKTEKFTFLMGKKEQKQCGDRQKASFQTAINLADQIDLLVLDEVLDAVNTGMISESTVIEFLTHKPAHLEVVLTGRNPSQKLLQIADYVTIMEKEKHPYDMGMTARRGIEY